MLANLHQGAGTLELAVEEGVQSLDVGGRDDDVAGWRGFLGGGGGRKDGQRGLGLGEGVADEGESVGVVVG